MVGRDAEDHMHEYVEGRIGNGGEKESIVLKSACFAAATLPHACIQGSNLPLCLWKLHIPSLRFTNPV
jgi:hypothetical protein